MGKDQLLILDSAVKIGFYVPTSGRRGPCGQSGIHPKDRFSCSLRPQGPRCPRFVHKTRGSISEFRLVADRVPEFDSGLQPCSRANRSSVTFPISQPSRHRSSTNSPLEGGKGGVTPQTSRHRSSTNSPLEGGKGGVTPQTSRSWPSTNSPLEGGKGGVTPQTSRRRSTNEHKVQSTMQKCENKRRHTHPCRNCLRLKSRF